MRVRPKRRFISSIVYLSVNRGLFDKYTSLHDSNSFELMESNRNKHDLSVRTISETEDSHKSSTQLMEQTLNSAYTIESILGKRNADDFSKDDEGESLNFTNTGIFINS